MSGFNGEELKERLKKMRWSLESDGTTKGTTIKDQDGKVVEWVQGFSLEMNAEDGYVHNFNIVLPAPHLSVKLQHPVVFFKDTCKVCGEEASFIVTKEGEAGAVGVEAECRLCHAKMRYIGWEVIKEK